MEKSKQIEKEIIMKLKDILKETVAEISYKNSGLKKPNLADLDKDDEISSYEKKRGSAIEKNMKTEFKTQAPKKEGIKFGNEERPMETMPSLSRSEMSAMNPMNNICEKCGASMMYEDKMCAECGYMEEDGDATSLEAALIGGPVKNDQDGYSEGMDHEVSMAKSSLQNIVSNASQLMNKMGDEEIDIPAWVQDHITNADNYISQANDGYYEYEAGENNETPDQPVYEAKPTGGKTPSNYAFSPKDAENKYKSAAISMLIPKLNPKDIPNIQKQLSKMDVDADFNIEKDGVRVWTRRGDYSNVGDVLKSKGLKRKQTMPTDADYQKWDDKLRASSGIKPTSVDKFGYTKNGQAAGPFRGAQGPTQMASGNLEAKKK